MATENPQHEEIEGASDLEEKEDLARKQLARMRPGLLRARTTIRLETVFGAYLFCGKNGENGRIIGLRHFANSLDKIWKNASLDPWALWYLLRIETAIDQV
jgi:hypothetical protein